MASLIVIKVKYGDTLRRFNANLNEGEQLDLDIEALKAKIRTLFNFPDDAVLTLTYIDEDQDVVALIDDNDVRDVVRQALNPVRINVQLNTGKTDKPSSRSSARGSPVPIHNSLPTTSGAGVADLLKSVPEPFRDPLTTLSLELASKAASSTPVLAELIDTFTKMGQAVLASQTTHRPAPTSSTAGYEEFREGSLESSAGKVDGPVQSFDGTQQLQSNNGTAITTSKNIPNEKSVRNCTQRTETSGVVASYLPSGPTLENLPNEKSDGNCTYGGDKQDDTQRKETSGVVASYLPSDNYEETAASSVPKKCSPSRKVSTEPPQQNERKNFNPFAMPYVPPPSLFGRAFNHTDNSRAQGTVFHNGVCCDGCGIIPIAGPRYKSKVKYNYDLCQICFEQSGNVADFQRIDYPVLNPHLWSLGAYSDGRNRPRPRLESQFISDVNIVDGTIMAPRTPFTKLWRMRNSGTLPWPRGGQLVWVGGDKFADTDIAELDIPSSGLAVEEELDMAINFVAPELAGKYISYWRMASPSGQKFGQRVWVLIQVDSSLNDVTLDRTENCGVDLNNPPDCSIKYPKQEQAGQSERMLVDIGYDVDSKSNPINFYPGSPLSLQPPQSLTFQPTLSEPNKVSYPVVDNFVSVAPTPSMVNDASMFSFPTYPGHNVPLNPNVIIPPASSLTGPPSDPKNDVAHQLPTTIFSGTSPDLSSTAAPSDPKNDVTHLPNIFNVTPPASSSTPPSDPKNNNVAHVPTIISVPNSQAGKGVANDAVEKALLNELVEMGFTGVELNKEVLRRNNYDLEKSLDELCCGAADWVLHLEELHRMGFYDDEMNKKVLVKNNGSLKHAVMDLISAENA